jgi:hypothetical protein
MGFMFAELNALTRANRISLYYSDPRILEEILLYYLSPICPANNWEELEDVVTTIKNPQIRAKMESLFFLSPSSIRRDGVCYSYDDSGTENVWIISTFEVLPPTDRLGGLYGDEKLNVVLAGMHNNIKLPPMKLRLTNNTSFEYEVVDGIHRYYASIKLGHGKLPAFIEGPGGRS